MKLSLRLPGLHTRLRILLPAGVEDEDDTRESIVSASDGPESLLPACIPEAYISEHCEIDPNCRYIVELSAAERCFPGIHIPDKNDVHSSLKGVDL